MTAEEFADRLAELIMEARKSGLADDDIAPELAAVLDYMNEDT